MVIAVFFLVLFSQLLGASSNPADLTGILNRHDPAKMAAGFLEITKKRIQKHETDVKPRAVMKVDRPPPVVINPSAVSSPGVDVRTNTGVVVNMGHGQIQPNELHVQVPGEKAVQAQVQVPIQAQTKRNPSQQCRKKLDLFFVIGCGVSCSENHFQPSSEAPSEALANWNKMKGFVMHVAQQLALGDESSHASVVQYTPQGANKKPKCSDVINEEALLDCLNSIPIASGHAGQVNKALSQASAKSKSNDRQKYVIVFVDERSHYGTENAQNLKKRLCGATSNCIISIAMGDGSSNIAKMATGSDVDSFQVERKDSMTKHAQALTGDIVENSLKAPTYEDLSTKLVQKILDLICNGAIASDGLAPEVQSPKPIEKPDAVETIAKSEEEGGWAGMFDDQ